MRSRAGRIALAVVFFLLPLWAIAQEITATIVGTVTDQTGAVLPGVTVTVRNLGTGFTKDVVSTGEGAYSAPLLPIGRYEVTFKLSGFQTATARDITLHVNDRVKVDAVLKAGAVSEMVEVTGIRRPARACSSEPTSSTPSTTRSSILPPSRTCAAWRPRPRAAPTPRARSVRSPAPARRGRCSSA